MRRCREFYSALINLHFIPAASIYPAKAKSFTLSKKIKKTT